MIKVRVIPQLLVADGLLKKPIRFQRPRTIASPISIARVFEARQVDELILLDIGCAAHHTNINPEVVAMISDELTVPLSVGGGVRDLETASRLIAAGAEKVVINSAAVETPELIGEIASRFGSQCTLVSIDAKPLGNGGYEVFIENGSKSTGLDPKTWSCEAVERGAGEILINSVEQDGTMTGYDTELIRMVANAVDVSVIAAGGAGKPTSRPSTTKC